MNHLTSLLGLVGRKRSPPASPPDDNTKIDLSNVYHPVGDTLEPVRPQVFSDASAHQESPQTSKPAGKKARVDSDSEVQQLIVPFEGQCGIAAHSANGMDASHADAPEPIVEHPASDGEDDVNDGGDDNDAANDGGDDNDAANDGGDHTDASDDGGNHTDAPDDGGDHTDTANDTGGQNDLFMQLLTRTDFLPFLTRALVDDMRFLSSEAWGLLNQHQARNSTKFPLLNIDLFRTESCTLCDKMRRHICVVHNNDGQQLEALDVFSDDELADSLFDSHVETIDIGCLECHGASITPYITNIKSATELRVTMRPRHQLTGYPEDLVKHLFGVLKISAVEVHIPDGIRLDGGDFDEDIFIKNEHFFAAIKKLIIHGSSDRAALFDHDNSKHILDYLEAFEAAPQLQSIAITVESASTIHVGVMVKSIIERALRKSHFVPRHVRVYHYTQQPLNDFNAYPEICRAALRGEPCDLAFRPNLGWRFAADTSAVLPPKGLSRMVASTASRFDWHSDDESALITLHTWKLNNSVEDEWGLGNKPYQVDFDDAGYAVFDVSIQSLIP